MKYKSIKLQIKDSQSLMSLDFNNSELIFSGDFLIINEFKEEQKQTCVNLVKAKTGIVYRRLPKYMELDERIKTIVSKYDKAKILETLESLSLLLIY